MLIISFIIGVLASLIAGLIILYLEFFYSLARFRVESCIVATRKILADNNNNPNVIKNEYRFSLSVIFYRLFITYGIKNNSINKIEEYPSMLRENPDIDGWSDYKNYVRPVVNDINSYVFISVLRYIKLPFMQELKCLQDLCIVTAKLTAKLDSIRLMSFILKT